MNSGLNTGLFEEKHRRAMGESVWLFGWLVGSQTRRNGLVHGGSIFTYKILEQKTGYGARTIETWLKRLESQGYVKVEHTNYKMMRIWILKQKKYRTKQTGFEFPNPASQREGSPSKSRQPTGSVPAGQRDTARQPTGSNKNLNMSSNETPEIERALPDGIAGLVPLPLWRDFVSVRTAKHKPTTPAAILILHRKLLEFQAAGDDPITVIEQSVVNCWADIFPLKKENGTNGANGYIRKSKEQERNERSAAALANVFGGHHDVSGGVRGDVPRGNHNATSHRLPGSVEGPTRPEVTARSVHARDAVIDVPADGGRSQSSVSHRVRERAKAETA
jgi:hypothetical protein